MKRAHKFGAVQTIVGDHKFPSKREAKRYGELKFLERAGQISSLELQPRYPLIVNGRLVGHYTGDFGYRERGKDVVEDVKAKPTMTEAYRLRVKVFRALYPSIDFREIEK